MTVPESWHLAQINIARARGPMDDPVMAEFAHALDEINALAEASPGFVWRLQDESGNATNIPAYPDPLIVVNITVWKDIESLRNYVYRSMHGKFFARRQSWFEKYDGAHLALWWIPAGHRPSVEEAKARLATLDARGPSTEAFTFREAFPPPVDSGVTS